MALVMRTPNVALFAIIGIGLSLSLTIFIMSSVITSRNCPHYPDWCAFWACVLVYSLLSLPIAILLLVGIQTRKSMVINAWLIATIIQVLIEIGVVGYLSSEESPVTVAPVAFCLWGFRLSSLGVVKHLYFENPGSNAA